MADGPPGGAGTRSATSDDLEDLARLAEAAIAEKQAQKGGTVWARRESRGVPARPSLAAALASDQHGVMLGTFQEVTVGYAVVRAETLADGGRLGVLEDLYVEPGAREVGVGEALMDQVVAWCRDRGCFGVDSLALPGDRSTKNFFESFGLVARAIVVHRQL